MKRKRIPVLASLTALLICLSACGSAPKITENPGVPDRPEDTANTQAAPEEEDGVEIHFVFPWLEALLRALGV